MCVCENTAFLHNKSTFNRNSNKQKNLSQFITFVRCAHVNVCTLKLPWMRQMSDTEPSRTSSTRSGRTEWINWDLFIVWQALNVQPSCLSFKRRPAEKCCTIFVCFIFSSFVCFPVKSVQYMLLLTTANHNEYTYICICCVRMNGGCTEKDFLCNASCTRARALSKEFTHPSENCLCLWIKLVIGTRLKWRWRNLIGCWKER